MTPNFGTYCKPSINPPKQLSRVPPYLSLHPIQQILGSNHQVASQQPQSFPSLNAQYSNLEMGECLKKYKAEV